MEFQTELGGVHILQNLQIHELSRDTSSRIYVLSLGNSMESFQRRHLKGEFEDFSFNPRENLRVWSDKKLKEEVVSEMIEEGLLEDQGDTQSKYVITEKGQRILNIYCIGVKILSQQLMERAGKLFVNADTLQKSDAWKFKVGEMFEDVEEAEEFKNKMEELEEKTGERPELISDIVGKFEKRLSEFEGVEKTRAEFQMFLINRLLNLQSGESLEAFHDEKDENMQEGWEDILDNLDSDGEVKYLEDVLEMIKRRVQPDRLRLGEEEEGFSISMEDAEKLDYDISQLEEMLEKMRARKEYEEKKGKRER
jgi:hypothetical protein